MPDGTASSGVRHEVPAGQTDACPVACATNRRRSGIRSSTRRRGTGSTICGPPATGVPPASPRRAERTPCRCSNARPAAGGLSATASSGSAWRRWTRRRRRATTALPRPLDLMTSKWSGREGSGLRYPADPQVRGVDRRAPGAGRPLPDGLTHAETGRKCRWILGVPAAPPSTRVPNDASVSEGVRGLEGHCEHWPVPGRENLDRPARSVGWDAVGSVRLAVEVGARH